MPNVGDELHHFGWNLCSSACHGPDRSHLIVPGFRSSRIHIVDVADDPRRPKIAKVIEPEEIVEKTGLHAPAHGPLHARRHRRHLDARRRRRQRRRRLRGARREDFELRAAGRTAATQPPFNYDFWYQPRKNTLVSTEWGAPNTFEDGFNPADVEAGQYGQRLHFWDLEERKLEQTIDLGEEGLIPLEVRWLHDPDADAGLRRRGALEHRCGTSTARTASGRPSR